MFFSFYLKFFFIGQRKSNAYLDVPSANFNHLHISDNDDEDVDRLRTFSSSKGGWYTSISFSIFQLSYFYEQMLQKHTLGFS